MKSEATAFFIPNNMIEAAVTVETVMLLIISRACSMQFLILWRLMGFL